MIRFVHDSHPKGQTHKFQVLFGQRLRDGVSIVTRKAIWSVFWA